MKTLPRIRFLIAWGTYRKGDVIQPQSAMARNALLDRVWYGMRVAELVQEPVAVAPAPPAAALVVEPESSADQPTEPPSDPTPARFGRGKNKRG